MSIKDNFFNAVNRLAQYVISIAFNLALLWIWLFLQFISYGIVASLKTDSFNAIIIVIFRLIFAILTLIPIMMRGYSDIKIMAIQLKKLIDDAKKN